MALWHRPADYECMPFMLRNSNLERTLFLLLYLLNEAFKTHNEYVWLARHLQNINEVDFAWNSRNLPTMCIVVVVIFFWTLISYFHNEIFTMSRKQISPFSQHSNTFRANVFVHSENSNSFNNTKLISLQMKLSTIETYVWCEHVNHLVAKWIWLPSKMRCLLSEQC